MTVRSSVFEENTGGYGGAILNNSQAVGTGAGLSRLFVIDSTFEGNRATSGGAIYNAGYLEIDRSVFSGNLATKSAVRWGCNPGNTDPSISRVRKSRSSGIRSFTITPSPGRPLRHQRTKGAEPSRLCSPADFHQQHDRRERRGHLCRRRDQSGSSRSVPQQDHADQYDRRRESIRHHRQGHRLTSRAGSTNNLIGDGTGVSGISNGVSGNIVGTAAAPIDPLLAPLGNYGGPTLSMPPLPGSPAIGAGAGGAGIPATDQRGKPRSGSIDIGSVQTQGFSFTEIGRQRAIDGGRYPVRCSAFRASRPAGCQ